MRFQDYYVLTEDSLKVESSDYEKLIVYWYNMINLRKKSKTARKLSGLESTIKKNGKEVEIKKNNSLFDLFTSNKKYMELGKKLVSGIDLPVNGKMSHFGSTKHDVSKEWLKIKSDTKKMIPNAKVKVFKKDNPKTDIKMGDFNISVKKSGSSQLISSMSGESTAIFNSVLNSIGKNIDKGIEEVLLYDKYWSEIDLKKITTLDKFKKEHFSDKLISELRKKRNKRDNDFIQKELSGILSKVRNNDLFEEIITGYKKHINLTKKLSEVFRSKKLKELFTEEALTGKIKFKGSDDAIATHLLIFNLNGNVKIDEITDRLIKEYSKKVDYYVSFKSSHDKVKSAIRGSIYSKDSDMDENYINNVDMLIESVWSNFLEKGKDVINNIIIKSKDIYDLIKNIFYELIKRISQSIQYIVDQGYQAIMSFFGIEIDTVDIVENPIFTL